jgi:hypothetical protein
MSLPPQKKSLCHYQQLHKTVVKFGYGNATRLTEANRWTLPQAYRLVACAFTPLLALPVSLLKQKSHILISSASSSPVIAPYACPVLDKNAHSPHCYRTPRCTRLSPPPVARWC